MRTVTIGRVTIPMSQVARIVGPLKPSTEYRVHTVDGEVYKAEYVFFEETFPAAPGYELIKVTDENPDAPTGMPWVTRTPIVAWKTYEFCPALNEGDGRSGGPVGLHEPEGACWFIHDRSAGLVYDRLEMGQPESYDDFMARQDDLVRMLATER